jgi:peptidoglycan/LPS O-acetylase OafA/YrhL
MHGTVLYALAFLLRGKLSAFVIFPVYLASAVIVSTGFCFLIEEPFLRLGRRLTRSSQAIAPKVVGQG